MYPSSYSFLKKVTPLFLLCFLLATAHAQSIAVNSTSIALTDNGSKPIQVTATDASAISYSAAGVPSWLGVTSTNAYTTPDNLYFQVLNTNCGACTATVTLTANSGGIPIPVTVTYTPGGAGGGGTLIASSTSLNFSGTPGGFPVSQSVTLSASAGSVTITGISTDSPSWLVPSIISGGPTVTPSSTATLMVKASPALLAAGSYVGHITITDSSGATTTITVTFVVNLVLNVTPGSLTFTAAPGQMAASQNLTISNPGGTTVSAVISSDVTWLAAQLVSGSLTSVGNSTPAVVSVTASATALQAGVYQGHITITPGTGLPTVVGVTFTVGAGSSGNLTVTPPSLAFTAAVGRDAPAQNLTLTSAAPIMIAQISSDVTWLATTIGAGSLNITPATPGNLSIVASAAYLTAGTYTGHIFITPTGASNVIVTVTFTVGGSPNTGSIQVDHTSFAFQYPSNTLSAVVAVSPGASGQSTFNVVVASKNNWLRFSVNRVPAGTYTNVGFGQFLVAVDTSVAAALPNGAYMGTLTFVNPSNSSDTTTVNLTLTVAASREVLTTPSELDFTASPGGASQSQSLAVMPVTTGPVTLLVTSYNGAFFSISSPACDGSLVNNSLQCTFTGSQSLTVTVNPGALTVLGKYSAALQFQSGSSSTTVYLVLQLVSAADTFTTSLSALTFASQVAGPIQTQSLSVRVPGNAPVQATLFTNSGSFFTLTLAGICSVTPVGTCNFSGNQTLTISATPGILPPGAYTGGIVFQSGGVTINVPVTLTIVPPNSATAIAAPSSLTFDYQLGSAAVVPQQTITVAPPATFTANASAATLQWLSIASSGRYVIVSVDPRGLAVGNYTGSITITTSAGLTNVPVQLRVANTPVVFATPGSIQADYQSGSPAIQTSINLAASNNSVIPVLATGPSWITVNPGGTLSTPVTLAATINPVALCNGLNEATIMVNAPGAANSGFTIPVVINVSGSVAPGCSITDAVPTVAPPSLAFSAQANGAPPPSQTLSVTAPQSNSNYSVNVNAPFQVNVQPSGTLTGSQTLTVSVNQYGLQAGAYTGAIVISNSSGSRTIPISLIVSSLAATPTSLTFSAAAGQAASPQPVIISTSSPTPVNILGFSSTQPWLTAFAVGGAQSVSNGIPLTVAVTANAISLTPGVYQGSLGVLTNAGTAASISVTLTVTSATGTNLAIGKIATQSSHVNGYFQGVPEAAIDGNTDGIFFNGSVTHTKADPNAWWGVDLGGPATINSITIWNRTDCCASRLSDYWVFVSDTPFLPTDTPATLQNRGIFASHQTVSPNPSVTIQVGTQGRFVRIQLSGTDNLSLAEVQIFGTGGGPAVSNLSIGRNATESSTLAGAVSARASSAVDGNTEGDYFQLSVTHTNADPNAWWQVDLGASAFVNAITIWNRTDCCSARLTDYWVFISDTPFLSTDTPAMLQGRANTYSSHQTTSPNPYVTIPFTTAQGRYVRIQLSNADNLSLAEVQVFGTFGPAPGNLARNKPASQSSTLAGYPADGAGSAVDGNTDGAFFNGSVTHTNADPNAWWQVDLGTSATISTVVVWNRTDCCSSRLADYWVFVSDTPFLATDTPATLQSRANTFSSHQTAVPSPSAAISIPSQGRYVRVQLSGTNNLSLAEVQVFGQ